MFHNLAQMLMQKVFGIGDNSLGQLGIGEDQPSAKKYQMVDFLKNQKTVKLGGYQNLSFFITEGGTLYYAGQISSQSKSSLAVAGLSKRGTRACAQASP